MAAITASVKRNARFGPGQGSLLTYSGTGAANSADTLTTTAATKTQRLAYVTCAYSDSPTQGGVTVTLDSQLGAAFDALLTTGSANAKYTVYLPDGDYFLNIGDAIAVAAPAGGTGITASIVVVLEEV